MRRLGMAQNFIQCDREQLVLMAPCCASGCRRTIWRAESNQSAGATDTEHAPSIAAPPASSPTLRRGRDHRFACTSPKV